MPAELRFSGSLKELNGGRVEINVETGQTVREALIKLNIAPEIIALVVVNENLQTKDYLIQDGDVIRLRAVIGGG